MHTACDTTRTATCTSPWATRTSDSVHVTPGAAEGRTIGRPTYHQCIAELHHGPPASTHMAAPAEQFPDPP